MKMRIKEQTIVPNNYYTCGNCHLDFNSKVDLKCNPNNPNFCSISCEKKWILNQKVMKGGQSNQMVKLLERAQNYEPAGKLKNISELISIPIDIDVTEKVFAEGTDKEFKAEVFTIDGEDYKMPATVIATLKDILEENPTLKTFKVKKSGSGLGTKYTVITLS